jgi:hypothetical protein
MTTGRTTRRFGAAGVVFSPDDIAGLVGWWKADSLSLSDNDAITTWPDSSGNGNTFAGAIGPTYKTAIQNGLPVARFDGVDDVLKTAALGWSNLTVFIVVKATADPAAVQNDTGLWRMSQGASTHYPFTDGVVYDGAGSDARKTVGNLASSLAAFRLYGVLSTAGEWTAYLDGVEVFTTGTNTVANPTGSAPDMWLGHNDLGNPFEGDIGEMLVYDAALSDTDREAVETYLADKWGL